MLEDGRPCGCCGCATWWLDVSFLDPAASSTSDGATNGRAMEANDSRTAIVHDVGAAGFYFSGSEIPPPNEYKASVEVFTKTATLTAVPSLFFENGAEIAQPPVFVFGWNLRWLQSRPLPLLYPQGWDPFLSTPRPNQYSWQALGESKYVPFYDSPWLQPQFDRPAGGVLLVPPGAAITDKGWLLESKMELDGSSMRFIAPWRANLDCQCYAWKNTDDPSRSLLTVAKATPAPVGGGEITSGNLGGDAAASLMAWSGSQNQYNGRIGPSGVLYARVAILQNGRPKAGKAFSFGGYFFPFFANGTITLVEQGGFMWADDFDYASGTAVWDGSDQVKIQDVTVNAESLYAVIGITGPPGKSVLSASVSQGTATYDDISGGFEFLEPKVWVTSGIARLPPAIRGGAISVYRDGALVYQGDATPTGGANLEGAIIEPFERARRWNRVFAMSSHGTYLIVSEKTGAFQTYRKEFISVVIDTERPIVASTAPNDIFVGETIPSPQVYATEPIVFIAFGLGFYTEDPQGVNNRRVIPSTAGEWRVLPASGGNASYSDRAGNSACHIPRFDLRIVPVPANNRRGARPQFSSPAPFIRPYAPRARRPEERVEWIDVTFDRRVLRESINISQVRLWKTEIEDEAPETTAVEPIGITEIGDSGTRWRIAIPAEPQEERTFWLVEYIPDEDVVTDDVTVVTVPDYARLPVSSAYKVLYVTLDTGKKYSKSPSGYVEVEGEYPLDVNGVEYEPEPCLLAARATWLMAGEDARNPIDVSHSSGPAGTVPTLSAEYSDDDYKDDGEATLTANSAGTGIAALGTYSYAKAAFTPGVPTKTSPAEDCSLFGLTTTIAPCPPKTLTLCKSPRVSQRRASLLGCDKDITGWTITPPEITQEDIDSPTASLYRYELPHRLIASKLAGEIEVAGDIEGVAIPQNQWGLWRDDDFEKTVIPTRGVYANGGHDVDIELSAKWVKASVSVRRLVRTYHAFETAFLGEVTVDISISVFVREKVTRDVPELNREDYFVVNLGSSITLTKEQEEAIDSGEEMEFSVSGDYQGRVIEGWKIRANTGC